MARKEQTALAAPSNSNGLAPTEDAEKRAVLASRYADDDLTGTEEKDATDVKTPSILFNMSGMNALTGRPRNLDEFLISDTEETPRFLRVVFITYFKSNAFKKFNETTQKNDLICVSYDRQVGTLRKPHPKLTTLNEGDERPCDSCPDLKWLKNPGTGKNEQACSEVFNVFGIILNTPDSDTNGEVPAEALGAGFMMKFTRSSRPSFLTYMNKHVFGKHTHPKMRGRDLPMRAYEVELSLEVDKGGKFARPVLTKGRSTNDETAAVLKMLHEKFNFSREAYIKDQESNEARHGDGEAIDTAGENSGGARRDEFADDERA